MARFLVPFGLVAALAACSPDYSPNSYASTSVQQANKVDQGVVVGRRMVGVTPSGTTGAVVGGAAGGIAGSQVGGGVTSAFGALGGSLVGGALGSVVEKTTGETTAYEYVVRKSNGDLLSVTQQDVKPLEVGQKVLVISGSQARIVPDYTVPLDPAPPAEHTDGKVPTTPPIPAAPLAAPPGASPAPDPAPPAAAATPPAIVLPTFTPPASAPATSVPATSTPAASTPPIIPLPGINTPLPPGVSITAPK